MNTFFNTAFCYLKGESGLPSVLPSQETFDKAKAQSRSVRLFCEGLDKFCEILYAEPTTDSASEEMIRMEPEVSADNIQDQELPSSVDKVSATNADSTTDSATEQRVDMEVAVPAESIEDQEPASSEDTVSATKADSTTNSATDSASEKTTGMEAAVPIESTKDEEPPSSEETVSPTKADHKPRRYVLAPGESLFESLYATDKTPPTSPGAASSSSTLVDPSSRKVSPSDSMIGAKASPTAVKDFAYPSIDSKDICDPLAIIDGNTKIELLRQLKRKLAGEEKAARKAEKQKAKNLALGADLDAAKGQVQSKDVQADVAKVHANAMILSNIVLRYVAQNGMDEPSSEKHGAKANMTKSAGETSTDQPDDTEGSDDVEALSVSKASDIGDSHVMQNGMDEPSSEQYDAKANTTKSAEETSTDQPDDTDEGSDDVEELSVATASDIDDSHDDSPQHDAAPGTCIAHPGGSVGPFEYPEPAGPATLWGILQSIQDADEARKKANAVEETASASEIAGPATLWGILQSDQSQDEVKDQTVADYEIAMGGDTVENQEALCTSSDSPVASPDTIASLENEVDIGEEIITSTSEVAGPATLWGILQSDQSRDEVKDEIVADNEIAKGSDTVEKEEALCTSTDSPVATSDIIASHENEADAVDETTSTSPVAGPATLWGILQSNQSQDEVEDGTVVDDEIAKGGDTVETDSHIASPENEADAVEEETASTSGIAGPATLWGILQSNQSQPEVKDETVADDEIAKEGGTIEDEEALCIPTISPIASSGGMPDDGVDDKNESAASATGPRAGEAAQSPETKANAVVSSGISAEDGANSDEHIPVTQNHPSNAAIPEEKKGPEVSNNVEKQDDQTTCSNVASGSSSITLAGEGEMASGEENITPPPTPSDAKTSSPPSFSPPQSETFDFIPPRQAQSTTEQLSKTHKRKLERKRAAARKVEAAAAELMRSVEEGAEQSPEP